MESYRWRRFQRSFQRSSAIIEISISLLLWWLLAIGYVDDDKVPDPNKPARKKRKEALLAREYYASHDAGQTATFGIWSWSRGGELALREQPFTLTGKGSLFLSEYRSKRKERLFSLGTGIVVGIVVAVVGAYVRFELGKL